FARSWPAKSSKSVRADCLIPWRLPKPRLKSWGLEADSGDRQRHKSAASFLCVIAQPRRWRIPAAPLSRERGFCFRHPLRSPRGDHLAKPINRWFVLVRSVGVPWYKRQSLHTKASPTETQAKLYAKSMLSERNYVTAGTMSP